MTSPDTGTVMPNIEGEPTSTFTGRGSRARAAAGADHRDPGQERSPFDAARALWPARRDRARRRRRNQSDDGTADVSRQTAEKLGLSDNLTVLDYPFDVSRCGLDHLWTPERSVHSLAYFYNWSFAQVATEYSMKWDGDMVLTPEGIAIVETSGGSSR